MLSETRHSTRRWLPFVSAGGLCILLLGYLYRPVRIAQPEIADVEHAPVPPPTPNFDPVVQTPPAVSTPPMVSTPSNSRPAGLYEDGHIIVLDVGEYESKEQIRIASRSTHDGKWFELDWSPYEGYNPNIIPHPFANDTYYMIAQASQSSLGTADDRGGPVYSTELFCEARLQDGKLQCVRSPLSLPIAATSTAHCTDNLEWYNLLIGPSDPRVFMGPEHPYIMYVSGGTQSCLGPWIHDLRRLLRWGDFDAVKPDYNFFWPTELHRPEPRGPIEKNWFAFWDRDGAMYLHHDIAPKRSFTKLSPDGTSTSGSDLAPLAYDNDNICLQRYMPHLLPGEHIHQSTNSLSITLCRRSDPNCDVYSNTYIMAIFHHKKYHEHNLYEPYVMLFANTPPFEVYAITAKPLWVSGRGQPGEHWKNNTIDMPTDQSQMMFMVSMNWKQPGLNYHGYLDDEIMIAFGVEDISSGGIDVLAGDMLYELNYCKQGDLDSLPG